MANQAEHIAYAHGVFRSRERLVNRGTTVIGPHWTARVPDTEGKPHRKYVSIPKYGEEEAHQLAERYYLRKLEELLATGHFVLVHGSLYRKGTPSE